MVQGDRDLRQLVWASLLVVAISTPMVNWSELRGPFLAPVVIATFTATVAKSRLRRKLVAVS